MKRFPGAAVFIYEKRDKPFGLIRYGVAPDHVTTKRVLKTFENIAAQPGLHMMTGVEVGVAVSLNELSTKYDAVVICTGAEIPRLPDIPGAALPGVVSGLDFARWVNGEEEALDARLLDGITSAVIIGNGNVALDAARMLARQDADWDATSIAPFARDALRRAHLHQITIVGRRSAGEASFTVAELREVVSLPGWQIKADQGLPLGVDVPAGSSGKVIAFEFGKSPSRVTGRTRVESVEFGPDSKRIPADLAIFATGQKGCPLPGLPFDEKRGVIPNDRGRVAGSKSVYVCGWIKRGAKGLIGHNRKDAIETVASMAEDFTPPSP